MNRIYLQFKANKANTSEAEPKNWLGRAIENSLYKILTSIIPKANPYFNGKIKDVYEWIIEVEEDEMPTREIGINKEGSVIMIMPWRENCGYWTDNNLIAEDFIESFECTTVNQNEFENLWKNFANNNS